MITIQKLRFHNWFSYGSDNEIDFTKDSLTQICGVNGSGKSSIPLILEETLFGKNSKGIKKADIPNRALEGCAVDSVVYFSANDIQYIVKLQRKGASTKLILIQAGEDISSHTATGTYAQISNILGIDYKLYTQLTYQSSTSSLQFLKATDTERKKFLISLFNLDEYLGLHETFKAEHKAVSTKLTYISGQMSASTTWLAAHKEFDFTEKTEEVELPLNTEAVDKLAAVRLDIANIKKINEEINRNNTYKSELALIDKDLLTYNKAKPIQSEMTDLEVELKVLLTEVATAKKDIVSLEEKGKDKICKSCLQNIPAEDVSSIVVNRRNFIKVKSEQGTFKAKELEILKTENQAYGKHKSAIFKFEKLTNYIDPDISESVIVDAELADQAIELEAQIVKDKEIFEGTRSRNSKAQTHNAKIDVVLEELKSHEKIVQDTRTKTATIQDKVAILQMLKDSFSTSGLITYKLEFVVKALEEEINEYLTELSSGRFQLVFVLVKDKLNIEIVDQGTSISIAALSAGELARVNTATVLAIRKLMANISKTKLNLLFLDEIMGVLDDEGKDTLVSLLMQENLNTFIISHEYDHPLVPQVLVVKNSEDISNIEGQ